ncbi:chromate reductase [Salsuginibacillus halophilus]|uniref:Chromate reductase n=1 Tax=Salsuginibacillus halophilus TaxID=517424 RepID=A0A2P8HXC5_9BACI|nr:NADPH-dependent FMN reductase [Salsuginibacillus halophilus]PSL50881.1 chromate reductase [Salsuginibacillus halophilus]
MGAYKILGIAGSLRTGSFNQSVLKELKMIGGDEAVVNIFSLADIPLFNADDEAGGDPETVQIFKDAIHRADAIYIVTPEYSHGMPGVLKNALDWAGSMANDNALASKPAAVAGASPSQLGTALSQQQVKQTLRAAGSPVLEHPEVYIGGVNKKVDDEGNLTDSKTKEQLEKSLHSLTAWIELLRNK